jgi:hypothetical protein
MMTKRSTTFILLILVFILFTTLVFAQGNGEPTGQQPWDLRYTNQVGQFSFYDEPAGASATGKPVDVGDFDGDGCGDLAITGQNASHGVGGFWRGSGGHVRIVMNVCDITGQIAMILNPVTYSHPVFSIYGAYAGDMAGTETYIVDFNNDGFDDLLFSAQNSDGPNLGRSNAGAAYILFGAADFSEHEDIDLRELPDDIFVAHGAAPEDRLGLWVEGGDFDGDGFHDALIGANQADGFDGTRANAGEAWIIYGAEDMFSEYGQVIDLQEAPENATRIIGADADDLLGSTVWGDDLNGDGYDDAIVSAALWRASAGVGGLSFGGADGPGNTRYNSGETFIIFGTPDLRGQLIDLAERMDEFGRPVDESMTVIYGPESNDLLGEEIATGDINGDGRLDLVLGTLIGDGIENNLDEAGEAWIIYTQDPFEGQIFDLAELDPERMVVIYPDQSDSKGGDTLRADDINGDGIDDVFFGAPDYDPTGYRGFLRYNAGILAIVMGKEGGLPHNDGRILLFDPPAGLDVRFIVGPNDNDMMPYALAIYDMNGDGVLDIIPNAMGGDGLDNEWTNAGEIYIIDGAEFLADTHVYVTDMTFAQATATPMPTTTPLPDSTAIASGEGSIALGRLHFVETCAGCHGDMGEGVPGLGLPLTTSLLVIYAPDEELLGFLKIGRASDHLDNSTGVTMPPSGGRPDWNDDDLVDIIAYLRVMRDTAQ